MTDVSVVVLVADRHMLDSELIAAVLSGCGNIVATVPDELLGADRVGAALVLVDAECPDALFEHLCRAAPAVGLLYDDVSWRLRERARRTAVVVALSRRCSAGEAARQVNSALRDGGCRIELGRHTPSVPQLSRRETEVLHLMARGLRNQDIAGDLRISSHTVRTHVQSVLAKLGTTSRVAAVGAARQAGLLPT